MAIKIKKIGLIIIGLLIFITVVILLIPMIVGMNQGYDSAMIEGALKRDCNCEIVASIKIEPNSETLVDDISSGKFSKQFSMELSGCNYANFEALVNDVQFTLNEKELCAEKNILLKVNNFKGESKEFSITNCQLNQEN